MFSSFRVAIAATALAVLAPSVAMAFPPSFPVVVAQRSPNNQVLRQAIIATLRRPGLPEPKIQKLVTEGTYGLATWTMGEAGGMVALIKEEGWEVYPMGGGMPNAVDVNNRCDMPIPVAQRLLKRI